MIICEDILMDKKDILAFVRDAGYESIEKIGCYKGWYIYDPIYSINVQIACIGLPSLIGVKNNEIKWFIGEEAFEIINSLQLDEN